jgi:hypothetical protein
MTILVALVAFAGAVIAISPSPDSLLVLRTATVAGPTKAFAAAAGVCAGLFACAPAAAFGISATLTASTLLYLFLKWAAAPLSRAPVHTEKMLLGVIGRNPGIYVIADKWSNAHLSVTRIGRQPRPHRQGERPCLIPRPLRTA